MAQKPIVLIVRDGWGYSTKKEGNAILSANTPVFDLLREECPHSLLMASGEAVGLPLGFIGNSEVGHIALGAGRYVKEPLTRINEAISSGKFNYNPAFVKAIQNCKKNKSNLHIMGVLSDNGVHGMNTHLYALLDMCAMHDFRDVCLHIFTDGKESPPMSAPEFLDDLKEKVRVHDFAKICTVIGREYSMDRNNRWERISKAYNCLTGKKGKKAITADEAIKISYDEGINDPWIHPTLIGDFTGIKEGDSIILYNYRLDAARELTRAFVDTEFNEFPRTKLDITFVCFCEYYEEVEHLDKVYVAFEPVKIENTFGEVISKNDLHQLRIAESEKDAHVTYFFDGEKEMMLPRCQSVIIPSPKVNSYASTPEMSASEITNRVIDVLSDFDFILINYGNVDLVGHTGDFDATVKAVEFEDSEVGRLLEAIRDVNGVAFITSDHGNAEEMLYLDGEINKSHSLNDVEFFIYNLQVNYHFKLKDGYLYDVAPTILDVMDIEKPIEMTGISLIEKRD